jgi:hypothetical protein
VPSSGRSPSPARATASPYLRCSKCYSSHTVSAISSMCSLCERSSGTVAGTADICPNCFRSFTLPHSCGAAGCVLVRPVARLEQCVHCKLWYDHVASHEFSCVSKKRDVRPRTPLALPSSADRNFRPSTSATTSSPYLHSYL